MDSPCQPTRLCASGRRLLVLQNPGRASRHCIEGLISGLSQLHVQHCVLELYEVWETAKTDPMGLVRRLSQILVQQKIGAVIGYGFNGMADMPADGGPLGTLRSFFEIRGIPHLMWWLDHPQWHADLAGLSPAMQGMFRSANGVHFFKSDAHALEMERMVGWPNCHKLPVAVAAEHFPVVEAKPDFDLVTICGERGELSDWLVQLAATDNPDPQEIRKVILQDVLAELEKLWLAEVPDGLRPEMVQMGRMWAGMKVKSPFSASIRFWPALTDEFPGACWYLTMTYPTYFKAQRILWRIREWERRFYVAYLARHFKVAVFGGDWSALGVIQPKDGEWVDYRSQSAIYARGKVALSIIDGHDEEGLTLKPFEIAASGTPMLHYRAEGLEECFTPGSEVDVFQTPAEAREKLAALLENDGRRKAMADAARQRVLDDHTWPKRIQCMFQHARLPLAAFQ